MNTGKSREARDETRGNLRLAESSRTDLSKNGIGESQSQAEALSVPPSPSEKAAEIRQAARSKNTQVAYTKAWTQFTLYCLKHGLDPSKACPSDVAEFFTTLSVQPSKTTGRPLSLGTLRLYRSALNRRFAELDRASPAAASTVQDVLGGLARLGEYKPRRVKALREHDIEAMLDLCPSSHHGRRDAAMIALGFAAALRRSELCGLLVTDINIVRDDRMIVSIRRSKTDQNGMGQCVAVPDGRTIKPITRVLAWLEMAGIKESYLFQTFRKGGKPSGRPLNHSEVPRLVKKYAAKIGLDPASFSGHSLRAGFVTSAAAHRARLDKIMEVTRHKNPTTVLQYIRDANVFEDHAGDSFL